MNIRKGHLLTSHWKDTAQGLEISYYGNHAEKPFKLVFTNQKVVFFILKDSDFSPSNFQFERKSGGFKNFSHQEVDTIYLNKYSDLQLAKDYCQIKGIRTFEMDVRPTERFLMERFIFGQVEFKGEFTTFQNVDIYKNPQLRPIKFHSLLSSLSLDIETGVDGSLYSIGLHYKFEDTVKNIVLMRTDQSETDLDWIKFCDSEEKILREFLILINKWDPDFIIGWHVIGFDLNFLDKKFQKYNIDFKLGRLNGHIHLDERKGVGFFADCTGRVVLDGPPVLRSAFYQFKNFKLETVATAVLGSGKDIESDGGKVEEIERRFKEDKEALAKYNLLDCSLVTDIFDKLNIFNLLKERTKISGMLFDRINISTAAFDHVFLPKLHRKHYVAPNRIEISREETSTGGLVIEPVAGKHKNIAVFDFKSLYPSIIMTFKIDPYSRIKSEINGIKTPKGFTFSKSEHLLPEIISNLMGLRQKAKENNDNALSQAIKILMNSFYGIMGSSRSRFYHSDLPSAITTSGHWILKAAMNFFDNRGLKVIYGDTDSIFIKFESPNKEELTSITNDLNNFIKRTIYEDYQIDSHLECEFEKLYDHLFFAQMRSGEGAAKKKYAGIINGQVEFKGMEFVRSDWTELAKDFQYQLYQKFFSNEELEFFIKNYIKDLENGVYDDKLIYTKRLSKAPEEYTKNVPIHVKAALKVNHTGPYRLKEVSYIITKTGPEPVNNNPKNFDYQHYIEKQLKPIADDVLISQNMSFDNFILGDQLSFF